MNRHRVFLSHLGQNYYDPIERGIEWIGIGSHLAGGTRVSIKPNLTFPTFRPGVMTNPGAVEAVVRYMKNFTNNIVICEADSGGYNRFSIDEVFQKTGLVDIANRYGVRLVNLSFDEPHYLCVKVGMRTLKVPLAKTLIEETDLFITMPVPKIHMNTIVSISMKNQWGTIQIPSERLKLHPYFDRVIHAVNKALPKSISIVDGRYALTRSGPMRGDVVELNWLMVADNIFAADFVCTHLMHLNPLKISYLRYALRKEGITDFSSMEFNTDYRQFYSSVPFYLKRAWTDYPGLFAFRSRMLAYVGYESPLAGLLHRILYLFREPFYDYTASKNIKR